MALLAQAQVADVVTTEIDRARGGVETNQAAAFILTVGGPGLFLTLKLAVVGVMAIAVLAALRYQRLYPGVRAEMCLTVLGRTLQASVVLLTLTALGNAHVAVQTAAAAGGT